MKLTIKLFTQATIFALLISCSESEQPNIDPVKQLEAEFSLENFDDPDSLILGNISIDWTDFCQQKIDDRTIYEFKTTSLVKDSLVFENFRSDILFSVIGWVEGGQSQLRILRFLPFKNYQKEYASYLESNIYSGSAYIHLLDGSLEQIITYESGEIIGQLIKDELSEQNSIPGMPGAGFCGDMYRKTDIIQGMSESCGGGGVGGCAYRNQTVNKYLDWYLVVYIGGEEISRTYLYSTYNGSSTQPVYTCGGTPNSVNKYRDEIIPEYPDGLTAGEWWESNNVKLSEAFKNDPCLMKIWNAAGKSDAAYKMLKGFLGEYPIAELELDVPSNNIEFYELGGLPGNDWAITKNWGQEIGIYFNSSKLSNSSLMFSAVILAHELIHAEMWRKLGTLPHEDGYISDFDQYQHDFPGLYDYIAESPVGSHNAMANHYRPQIISFLKEIDTAINGYEKNSSLYEALSWLGLKGSSAWNQLSASTKNNYINKHSNEDIKGKCN